MISVSVVPSLASTCGAKNPVPAWKPTISPPLLTPVACSVTPTRRFQDVLVRSIQQSSSPEVGIENLHDQQTGIRIAKDTVLSEPGKVDLGEVPVEPAKSAKGAVAEHAPLAAHYGAELVDAHRRRRGPIGSIAWRCNIQRLQDASVQLQEAVVLVRLKVHASEISQIIDGQNRRGAGAGKIKARELAVQECESVRGELNLIVGIKTERYSRFLRTAVGTVLEPSHDLAVDIDPACAGGECPRKIDGGKACSGLCQRRSG